MHDYFGVSRLRGTAQISDRTFIYMRKKNIIYHRRDTRNGDDQHINHLFINSFFFPLLFLLSHLSPHHIQIIVDDLKLDEEQGVTCGWDKKGRLSPWNGCGIGHGSLTNKQWASLTSTKQATEGCQATSTWAVQI